MIACLWDISKRMTVCTIPLLDYKSFWCDYTAHLFACIMGVLL